MNWNIKKDGFCFTKNPLPIYTTLYKNEYTDVRAVLLYFHGGGLLYGNRDDLPSYHIEELCQAGFAILTFDYRLAPATKIGDILSDVQTAILWYLSNRLALIGTCAPYFLWGRSAGAYLCLLTGTHDYPERPAGVISYYGYAFLEDVWYHTPNPYYLTFPATKPSVSDIRLNDEICTMASLEQRYSLYLYARQTGHWHTYFYSGREKYFFLNYTLRGQHDFSNYPPVFLAHSIQDPDVPYSECKALLELLPHTMLHPVNSVLHDFDRIGTDSTGRNLLGATVQFVSDILTLQVKNG